jgi:hypothetical protein
MCTEIMNEANTIFKESGFLKRLEEAKAELIQAFGLNKEPRNRLRSEGLEPENLSKATKSTIELCGFAEYAPNPATFDISSGGEQFKLDTDKSSQASISFRHSEERKAAV